MSVLSLRKREPQVEGQAEEQAGLAPVPVFVVLPRVNLLPPEIEQRRTFRRVQTGLGGAVLTSVALVALLYAAAAGAVSEAETDVAETTAIGTSLRAETTQYSDVTAVYAEAAAAKAMLTQAMGDEVRWSRLLNDLSLTVPDDVWVKNVAFTQTPAAVASAGTAAAPAAATTAAATGPASIGTVTFNGVGFGHDAVAVWLESLAGQKGYADPYFSNAAESLIGTRKVVTFTSTTTLTDDALSRRYLPSGS